MGLVCLHNSPFARFMLKWPVIMQSNVTTAVAPASYCIKGTRSRRVSCRYPDSTPRKSEITVYFSVAGRERWKTHKLKASYYVVLITSIDRISGVLIEQNPHIASLAPLITRSSRSVPRYGFNRTSSNKPVPFLLQQIRLKIKCHCQILSSKEIFVTCSCMTSSWSIF